jgi:C4-dicarboxylate-specific signal transduction histidine kinase
LNQVITNLISNAIDAYEPETPNKREISVCVKKKRNAAEIIVQDFGSGIKKEFLSLIFQPFFTTKNFEKGIGIGLSICKDIIEKDFKGKITVTSQLHAGTLFVIAVPLVKMSKKRKINIKI